MRSGLDCAMARAKDLTGANPRYLCKTPATFVFVKGWRGGQIASTWQPASARASASRTAGSQRHVVATRTFGFKQSSYSRQKDELSVGSIRSKGRVSTHRRLHTIDRNTGLRKDQQSACQTRKVSQASVESLSLCNKHKIKDLACLDSRRTAPKARGVERLTPFKEGAFPGCLSHYAAVSEGPSEYLRSILRAFRVC